MSGLIVWCLDCHHQVEPDPTEMAERYGAEMTVPDWHSRLVCSRCGSRIWSLPEPSGDSLIQRTGGRRL
jgi:DNA-directed RNA polymerase subunit RPC12/RpoP